MIQRESGGLLVQSAHYCPLTLLSLSPFFSFTLSLVLSLYTSLRGSTSINNPALSRHTYPSLCVHVCVRRGDLFAVHTKKLDRHVGTLLCLQTCVQIQHFLKTHRTCECVSVCCSLVTGVGFCCYGLGAWGFSCMTHHVSRCPLHPTLPRFRHPLYFSLVYSFFTPLLLSDSLKEASQLLSHALHTYAHRSRTYSHTNTQCPTADQHTWLHGYKLTNIEQCE